MEAPDAIQQVSTFDNISQINRDPRLSATGLSYRYESVFFLLFVNVHIISFFVKQIIFIFLCDIIL